MTTAIAINSEKITDVEELVAIHSAMMQNFEDFADYPNARSCDAMGGADEVDELSATKLRKLVYEMGDYKGRSQDIRQLKQADHLFMIYFDLPLDFMLAVKEVVDRQEHYDLVCEAYWELYEALNIDDNSFLSVINHPIIGGGDIEETNTNGQATEAFVEEQEEEVVSAQKPKVKQTGDKLTDSILEALVENIDFTSVFSKEQLNKAIHEKVISEIESVRRVSVEVDNGETSHNIGIQHEKFDDLLAAVSAKINVLMVGGAGSGKTHAAESVAAALDLPFYSISVGQQTSKVDFMGYMDAHGNYVRTHFRDAFEHGGVFLIDELDAGNANVITTINAATSNQVAGFPDAMVEKHEDFIVVGAANTYGHGANRQYVGRSQLDNATLDRFVTLDWDYDEKLERELVGHDKWVKHVQRVRKTVRELNLRHIVSPRASMFGARLLAKGMSWEQVENMTIYKGMDKDARRLVLENL